MATRAMDRKDLELLEGLYDLTPEDDFGTPPINDGLTDEEKEEVEFYLQLKSGVMVITGEPGAGKDTVMYFLLWKLRTLFKDFRVLLDCKPRMLFGQYIPFDEEVLMNEFKGLSERYRSGDKDIKRDFAQFSKHKEELNQIIDHWLDRNDSLFYNAGIGLTEFWRYFRNREPHNPINKAVSPLLKRYRHHNLLIIGTTPDLDELDVKACLRRLTHEIRCSQTPVKGLHRAVIYRRREFQGGSILETATPPVELYVDALKPRKRLGGKCIYNLFNSKERRETVPNVKFKV